MDTLQAQLFACARFSPTPQIRKKQPLVLAHYDGTPDGWLRTVHDLDSDPAWASLDTTVQGQLRAILDQLGTRFLFGDLGLSYRHAVVIVKYGGLRQILRIDRTSRGPEDTLDLDDMCEGVVEPWRRRLNTYHPRHFLSTCFSRA
jgi:hypothetical protein